MAEWLRNIINSWLGSNVTYVANAYPGASYVCLLFHNKIMTLKNIKLSGSPGALERLDIKIDFDVEIKTEQVIIPYGDFHKKQRQTAYEYMTIVVIKKDESNVKICDNYRIDANRSFIITKGGGIKPQMYGGDLWTDEFDANHKPDCSGVQGEDLLTLPPVIENLIDSPLLGTLSAGTSANI